jgi:chromosome segregation ATPase
MQGTMDADAEPPIEETSQDAQLAAMPEQLSKALKSSLASEPGRLPRRVAGGFRALEEEMERRSREWTQAMRLLEQHRMQLESAEAARDALNDKLKALMPEVQDSGRALKAMLDTSKSGDVSGNLTAQFEKSMRALGDLEKTASALNANFLWVRSAWEQYARSVIEAQRMREEAK